MQLVTSGVKLGTYRPDDADDELEIRVRLPLEERSFDSLDSAEGKGSWCPHAGPMRDVRV